MFKNLLAQNSIPLGPGFHGVGPLGVNQGGAQAATTFTNTLSKVIGVLTVVAFIWFTFQMILGAIGIVSSGGDKGSVEKARKQITTGILGVVMVIAAIFIVSLLGTLFGLNNILNPVCILSANGC